MSINETNLDEKVVVLNSKVVLTEEELEQAKKISRKIDLRLLPIIVVLYVASIIDRTNIGAALVNGLIKEFNLDARLQTLVTAMFYVFYTTLELPSNILLKRVKPRYWFSLITLAWSITCMLQAAAKNATVFIVFRSILGAVESGFAPGMIAFLPYWYTREEVGFRTSVFFGAIPISGLVGSPLAAALASIKSSLAPYQMIFLVEGAVTFVLGVAAIFILQDYPETCTFLTNDEKALVIRKLKADQGLATRAKLSFFSVLKAIFDWRTAVYCVFHFAFTNVVNSIVIFGPTLMKGLGYDPVTATYLTSIPCAAGVLAIIASFYLPKRIPLNLNIFITLLITTVFLVIMAFGKGKFLRMFAFTCLGIGVYPGFPMYLSWMSTNQGGIGKRLVVTAVVFSVGNVSGAVLPVMFTTNHAPRFITGFIFLLACNVLAMILVVVLALHYKSENRRKEKNPVDVSHMSEDDQQLLYNEHPQFRYTL